MSTHKATKLLWMDLEMTGLEPQDDRILEVGIVITDFEFKELDTYEAVIFQEAKVLDRLKKSDWYEYPGGKRKKVGTVHDMASKNGLIDRVASGKSEPKVEAEVAKLIRKHFDELAVLAGSSIHQDRRFIRHWWPEVEKLLHYRMLDVTAYKILMQGKYGVDFNKPDEHRALEDIRGSIQELRYYLKKLPKYLDPSQTSSDDK